jgi:hypothetical protein
VKRSGYERFFNRDRQTAYSRFTPQYIELVPKDKDFGLQGSPRPEQPDDSAPDQSAEIAHRGDYQRFEGDRQPILGLR